MTITQMRLDTSQEGPKVRPDRRATAGDRLEGVSNPVLRTHVTISPQRLADTEQERNISTIHTTVEQVASSAFSSVDALTDSIVEGQKAKGRLTRLDDQTWGYFVPEGVDSSFEEIRIQVPSTHNGRDAFAVAQSVAKVFDQKITRLREAVLKTGINIPIDVQDPALSGTWHIGIHTPKGIVRKAVATITDTVTQAIPFTRSLKDRKVVVVVAEKLPSAKKTSSVALPILMPAKPHSIGGTSADVLPAAVKDRLLTESYVDPFTRLATECFQKHERFFVMEAEHRGNYRFVIDEEGKIRLEEKVPSREGYAAENRRTVKAYVDYLIKEYGRAYVSQIETSYNLSFDQMILEGQPLLPDHVSKCNIGVNSIEISHVDTLARTLQQMASILQKESKAALWEDRKSLSAGDFLARIVNGYEGCQLSVREARGLLRSISTAKPTLENLLAHLQALLGTGAMSARDLHPEAFNTIVSMIMPTDGELDRAFTGRKIRHLTVMGFHTMGDANTPNPCRDQFELLHVFSECRKTNDWKNYYELLSHVVCKKSLFRQTPTTSNSWHVGLLLPAPDSPSGQARWYCNDAFYDDHNGNVNYILLPACRGYRTSDGKALPMIKLYRSTCSDRNAVNWQDSVAADLNPYGSPHSLNPEVLPEYERAYIEERTIPAWMGYLMAARQRELTSEQSREMYRDRLIKAAVEFIAYTKKRHLDDGQIEETIEQMVGDDDLEKLERALTQYGHYFKEDPQYKIAQDMVFSGHSLGGALAQYGMSMLIAKEGRLPLPGTDVTCYSSDGPAIDAGADATFMAFGRQHGSLLADHNSRMHVIHQLEYGDFVPQAGDSHLGTTGFDEARDCSWLDFSASIFRPLDGARALAVVTPGTAHARRIGLATEGIDYSLTKLTPKNLWDFHNAYFLRGALQRAFGYRILRSPRMAEMMRWGVGYPVRPFMKFYQWWAGNQLGSRDENGVFAIDDGHHARDFAHLATTKLDVSIEKLKTTVKSAQKVVM